MAKKMPAAFDSGHYYKTRDFHFQYIAEYLPQKRSRASEDIEIFFFLEGKMSLRLGEETIPLKRNDIVFLPPGTAGVPFFITERIPNRLFFLRLRKSYIGQLMKHSADFGYLFDSGDISVPKLFHCKDILFNEMLEIFLSLADELQTDRYGKETKIRLKLLDLILQLNRTAAETEHPPIAQQQKDRHLLYRNLIQYIDLHLDEDLTLDHLAEVFFVSKYHISHLFKENLGIPIHQYITKKRLSLCREDLINGANITKTCHLYGFKDYSSFYRAFHKEFGLSPKQYLESQNTQKND